MNNSLLATAISITALFCWGCQKESFTLTRMAEDHFFLKSGNQHMPVTLAGNIDSKKIVVIIHGGPGGNGLDYSDSYAKEVVEKEMVVVYWDQRFAGNSQGNGRNTDISEFRKDIKKLLILLGSKYGPDNDFYLFAHSWGGFLAPYFLVDGDNQEMVKGWIQIGGAHNYLLNDSLTREMLLHFGNIELAAGNNTSDWDEIVEWCNQNGFKGRENGSKLNGFAHRAEELIQDVAEPRFSLNFKQIQATAFHSHLSNEIASAIRQIDQPTYTIPITDQLHKIHIPTLLLWGKYDFVCPPELADDIENHIGSTDVEKFIYECTPTT